MRERACSSGLKYMQLHLPNYAFVSWYVHAGATGTRELGERGMACVFAYSRSPAQKSFLDATILCARVIRVSHAIPEFRRKVQEVALVPGKILVQEEIGISQQATKKVKG